MSRIGLALLGAALTPAMAFADIGAAPEGYNPAFDTTVSLPSFQLGPDDGAAESVTFSVSLTGSNPIIGMTFSGAFNEIFSNTDAYASDMRLDVLAPSGAMFSIGGFGFEGAPNAWEFQGGMSADSGLYSSTHWQTEGGGTLFGPGETVGGVWQFTFSNTFGTQTQHDWSDVYVTFHSIPTPGSMALIGMAGFVTHIRRRKR